MTTICILAAHQHLRDALTFNIQTQGQNRFVVVGQTGNTTEDLFRCVATHPTIVVVTIGIETGQDLRRLASIRQHSPNSRVVAVDTVGNAAGWPGGWPEADAVLRTEQLAAELVPTLVRLAEATQA